VNILFDGRVCWDHFTGIGRYAFGLLRHLPPAFPEHRFTVAWNPAAPNHRFDWDAISAFDNVALAPCKGTGLGPMDPLEIRALARSRGAELLQAPYFAGAVLSSIPTAVTLFDATPFERPRPRGVKDALARWGIARAARKASCVVTPTGVFRTQVVARFALPEPRVVAIPIGVDAPAAGPLHDPTIADRPYVLYVGVQKEHKNLVGLISALRAADPSGEVRLVLAGPLSAATPSLRAHADALGMGERVLFTGALEDAALGPLYRSAAVLALVSFSEGFGLPLAEAMSARVPVVASDLPVLREVCGGAALYVDPHSGASIAEGLAGALRRGSDAEERLAEGERRAGALSWPEIAKRYAVCYEGARP